MEIIVNGRVQWTGGPHVCGQCGESFDDGLRVQMADVPPSGVAVHCPRCMSHVMTWGAHPRPAPPAPPPPKPILIGRLSGDLEDSEIVVQDDDRLIVVKLHAPGASTWISFEDREAAAQFFHDVAEYFDSSDNPDLELS